MLIFLKGSSTEMGEVSTVVDYMLHWGGLKNNVNSEVLSEWLCISAAFCKNGYLKKKYVLQSMFITLGEYLE